MNLWPGIGVDSWLGTPPNTTAIYTHLTQPSEEIAVQAINRIVAGLLLQVLKLRMGCKEFQQS